MHPEGKLQKIVKDAGAVQAMYGGFRLRVDNPVLFPWYELLNELVETGQEIWIVKKEGRIYITSKPAIP
jgi:hypothetical protein